jgi:hypothetical protein
VREHKVPAHCDVFFIARTKRLLGSRSQPLREVLAGAILAAIARTPHLDLLHALLQAECNMPQHKI